MTRVERPTVLLEEIDYAIRDVILECFVLFCYENTLSPSKSPSHWFFHVDVMDTVGTTTITVNVQENLVKTHVDKLKKRKFLLLKNFNIRGQSYYDKGDSD
jgi:hypothetical protein